MGNDPGDFRRAEAAWSAGRRMIARKDRPCYRVAETGDGSTFHVIELPWIRPFMAMRSTAIERARETVAGWLDVDPQAFDIERD